MQETTFNLVTEKSQQTQGGGYVYTSIPRDHNKLLQRLRAQGIEQKDLGQFLSTLLVDMSQADQDWKQRGVTMYDPYLTAAANIFSIASKNPTVMSTLLNSLSANNPDLYTSEAFTTSFKKIMIERGWRTQDSDPYAVALLAVRLARNEDADFLPNIIETLANPSLEITTHSKQKGEIEHVFYQRTLLLLRHVSSLFQTPEVLRYYQEKHLAVWQRAIELSRRQQLAKLYKRLHKLATYTGPAPFSLRILREACQEYASYDVDPTLALEVYARTLVDIVNLLKWNNTFFPYLELEISNTTQAVIEAIGKYPNSPHQKDLKSRLKQLLQYSLSTAVTFSNDQWSIDGSRLTQVRNYIQQHCPDLLAYPIESELDQILKMKQRVQALERHLGFSVDKLSQQFDSADVDFGKMFIDFGSTKQFLACYVKDIAQQREFKNMTFEEIWEAIDDHEFDLTRLKAALIASDKAPSTFETTAYGTAFNEPHLYDARIKYTFEKIEGKLRVGIEATTNSRLLKNNLSCVLIDFAKRTGTTNRIVFTSNPILRIYISPTIESIRDFLRSDEVLKIQRLLTHTRSRHDASFKIDPDVLKRDIHLITGRLPVPQETNRLTAPLTRVDIQAERSPNGNYAVASIFLPSIDIELQNKGGTQQEISHTLLDRLIDLDKLLQLSPRHKFAFANPDYKRCEELNGQRIVDLDLRAWTDPAERAAIDRYVADLLNLDEAAKAKAQIELGVP